MSQLLFSLTANDFTFQTFCTGGKGGQHRNAKQNGVRCIHPPSGAVGEDRDGREQYKNRQEAFKKCCESDKFKAWHKLETMRRLGQLNDIEERVDDMMQEQNIKVEYFATAEERRNQKGIHGS